MDSIREELLGYASLAVERRYAESFLQRLEGWFFERASVQMFSAVASDLAPSTR
ncbi:hypothetical protein ACPCKL_31520 [Streptomyces cellulosae]